MDPNTRYSISAIRSHDWYSQIKSVELEGIIVGVDKIPIIEEVLKTMREDMKMEDSENAATHIKMNKHNSITTTYYLLIKKQERETGENLIFERVTKDKRSYHSTANLSGIKSIV